MIDTEDIADLEAVIAAFEEDRMAGKGTPLGHFVTGADPRRRAQVECELVRVDLEIADEAGEPRTVDDYRREAPELFDHPPLLALAAFEEWRLANGRGESLPVDRQLERYGLNAEVWPSVSTSSAAAPEGPGYPAVGETFDGMPLERELGSGAFSRVYVARQRRFGSRPIALKVTSVGSIEPERLGRLQHTNVVPIYSAHYDRGLLGIAMPLLGERTLAHEIGRRTTDSVASTVRAAGDRTVRMRGDAPPSDQTETRSDSSPYAWREATRIVADLAAGLHHAHDRGLVHGDIKPANVLIGDDGVPRLLDFNLSSDSSERDRQTLIVGGTLPYLAPEQLEALLGGQAVTPRCDLFSLGALLFELLSGQRPYPDRPGELATAVRTMRADRETLPRLPVEAAPPGLAAIVAKCLAPLPADRYQSAAQLESELRRELEDRSLRFTQEPSLSARIAKWGRRNRRHVGRGVTALCVVLAIGAAALAAHMQQRASALHAEQLVQRFATHVADARLSLAIPNADPDLRDAGLEAARAASSTLGAINSWSRLADEQQAVVATGLAELALLVGEEWEAIRPATIPGDQSNAVPPALAPVESALESLRAGEFSLAATTLQTAIEERPRDPLLWLLKGFGEAAAGEREHAFQSYAATIALQPEAAIAWRTRAYAAMDCGRFEDALADLDRAAAMTPGSPHVEMNRAIALYGLGRTAEAVSSADRAIAAGLTQPRAYLLRARYLGALGERERAAEDRAAGLAATPLDDQDWAARAVALKSDDAERALAEVNRGLAQHPGSVVLLRNKVHLLGDVLGRRGLAEAAAADLLDRLPNDRMAKLGLAVCLAERGEVDRATRIAYRVSQTATRPLDRLQLACVYALASEHEPESREAAIAHVQAALAGDPLLARRAATDPDLASLRNESRFRSAVAASLALSSNAEL